MTEQICPTCGCNIGTEAYEKEGIAYCCEPCGEQSACTCGCCKPVTVEKKSVKKEKPE